MDKNQTVRVGIRIRPLNKREREMNSPICVDNKDNVLSINKEDDAKDFVFDYVFGIDARQESIYESCGYSLVENALDGYNGTIFAYGQTGAGKTFTMVGDYKDPDVKGIIPRAFDHIISAIQVSESRQYVVRASFIEIYNEDIMDLLEEKKKNESTKKDLKQSPGKGVFIKDLKMVPVKSIDELFQILDLGNKNRTVFATAMNAVSSRSHAIFTVHIQSLEGKDKVKASKLNLVDLAGSERQSKTEATGDRLKEAAKINLSLSALGNVINALVDGKKGGHIPYRDSKLTRMLQDSLGGNTKTLMIASVSPAEDNYDETISTLRYAARARNIKNTPKVNEDPKDAMIREYLQEIQNLKKQLTGVSGGQSMGVGFTTQQQEEIKKKAENAAKIAQQAKQQVAEKSAELNQKEQQIRMMQARLKEMEDLVLKKGEVSPEILKAQKLKKKKIMKQQQLIEQRLVEISHAEHQLLDEKQQESEDQLIETKNPEQKAQYWKNLTGKLRKKLKNAIKDKQDVQKQFEVDRQDLNKTIRNLQGDLSFYKQLTEKFINEKQIFTLKENSEYDEEKRQYTLPPFMMHEESLSLPKTLKKHEVDDLWKEKRKGVTMKLLKEDLPQINSPTKGSFSSTQAKQPKGSPFIENRKIFKVPDYNDPKYAEKDYNVSDVNHIFRRTNFRINDRDDSRSRNNSKNNSKQKLQPLNRPTSRSKEDNLRPTSSSKGKQKLAPIRRN